MHGRPVISASLTRAPMSLMRAPPLPSMMARCVGCSTIICWWISTEPPSHSCIFRSQCRRIGEFGVDLEVDVRASGRQRARVRWHRRPDPQIVLRPFRQRLARCALSCGRLSLKALTKKVSARGRGRSGTRHGAAASFVGSIDLVKNGCLDSRRAPMISVIECIPSVTVMAPVENKGQWHAAL